MADDNTVFRIPARRLGYLTKRIEHLNKVAKKLGCAPVTMEVVNTVDVEEHGEFTEATWYTTYYDVAVGGEPPVLNGWRLVAKLEPLPTGTNMIVTFGDVRVPARFRETGTFCDHCKSHRDRNLTFVVQNVATGAFKQVGSTCLKDFTGHANPQLYARFAEMVIDTFDVLGGGDIDDFDFIEFMVPRGRVPPMVPLYRFMVRSASIVRDNGFVSRKTVNEHGGMPTSDLVWLSFTDPEHLRKMKFAYADIEADYVKAEETLMWIANHFGKPANAPISGYEANVEECMLQGIVTSSMAPYMTSAIAAYDRYMEKVLREQARSASPSQWVGEIGKRSSRRLYVTGMHTTEGVYGTTYIYKFIDKDGNEFVWFATNQIDVRQGDTCDLKCTVKAHNEFRGVKNTVLTRCKLEKVV